MGETPRVWVGCLACYNAGDLIGAWVDAIDGPEYVPPEHVVRCLSCGIAEPDPEAECPARRDREPGAEYGTTHYVGITGPDGDPHEEQWVMDHEGFGGLLSGECSPAEAARLAEAIERMEAEGYPVEAVAAWRDNIGAEYADLEDLDGFGEAYCGEWASGADYAEDLAGEIVEGLEDKMSSWPWSCIDWERAWNELRMGGDNYAVDSPAGVYVFRSA
jgi:hypothetical protein